MAIYLSDLMTNGAVVNRSPVAGQKFSVTGNVRIPAGTDLATTDKILIARFPTGTMFDQIIVNFPDLDDGTQLALNVGYDRPVTDPSKAYNASTNPYITGAIAAADEDFFEAAATTAQAGGVLNLSAAGFTVTSSPVSSGFVDVSITPSTGAQTATTNGGQIEFLINAVVFDDNQTQGEFSGKDAYNYTTNYDI